MKSQEIVFVQFTHPEIEVKITHFISKPQVHTQGQSTKTDP